MASYFSHLPNVYVGKINRSDDTFSYELVKNIFRRVILEDKLEKYSTQFEAFYVEDGMRPEMVASTFYGDAELDWVILIANNITDVYEQWPKSTTVLTEYVNSTYGDPDSVHHWETRKISYENAVFVKEGIEVNETYRVQLPDGTTLSKDDSIYPVSNFEHETYLNEKKRLISIPTNRLIDFFKQQFKTLVAYAPRTPGVDSDGNKKTEISASFRFIETSSFRGGN